MRIKRKNTFYSILMLIGVLAYGQTNAQIGILTIDGDLTIGLGTTEIEIQNTSGPGTGHDQVVSTGNLTLNGPLDLVLDGYAPQNTDFFEIMDYSGTLTGAFSIINWPGSMSTWMIDYGILSPGKVTIYGPQALPIELTYFTGNIKGVDHLLTWQTASEINNEFFEIEHSNDGRRFQVAARVEGAGNSSSVKNYNYTFKQVNQGTHYYRLKQVDFDGQTSYSQIVALTNKGADNIVMFPNPSNGKIYFNEEVRDISIVNALGQVVFSKESVSKQIDISHLPNGQYYISLNDGQINKTFTLIQD